MKQIVFLFGLFGVLFLGVIYGNSQQINNRYKEQLIDQEKTLISGILEQHPELEDELITLFLNEQTITETGELFFETYGIDLEGYDNIRSVYQLKQYVTRKFMFLYILIVLFFFFLFLHHLVKERKEIREITTYLNHILSGDYSFEIDQYDEGEISILKNDIYKITSLLRDQIAYSKNEKKHLESVLSDISHQLKTPLTSMYVINDILQNDEMKPAQKKEMLNKNKRQLKRIEWLVSSLLKLSRLDSGVVVMHPKSVYVRELIDQALEPLRIPIELKEQNIEIIGEEELMIEVDVAWTIEAFVNLIKNAHEHTPNNGTIRIVYTDNPIYIQFQIEDNGEGISSKDLPFIFERFYKGSSSNNDSIGIGLNMSKTIIQKQNGLISVDSVENMGTTFTIKFYKSVL